MMFRFGHFGMGFFGLGLVHMILTLIFWVVIIVLVVKLFRAHRDRANIAPRQTDNALEILRSRYAKGEIDTEEYNRRKQDLLG